MSSCFLVYQTCLEGATWNLKILKVDWSRMMATKVQRPKAHYTFSIEITDLSVFHCVLAVAINTSKCLEITVLWSNRGLFEGNVAIEWRLV